MSTKRSQAALRGRSAGVRAAVVVAAGEDPGRVEVRVAAGGERARRARMALAVPYAPAEGDRVLVAEGEGELYVIGVLHAKAAPRVALPDGGAVTVRDGVVEIEDPAGRVVVRYAGGSAEIAAPAGDLTLCAPAGRVLLRAATEVEIAAGAHATTSQLRIGPLATRLSTSLLEVTAESSHVSTTQATVMARRIATTASAIVQNVERFELTATRLVEKTRDTFRDASELAQTRVGRARMIVKDAYTLYARRTSLTSTEDTSIDGSKVLLG